MLVNFINCHNFLGQIEMHCKSMENHRLKFVEECLFLNILILHPIKKLTNLLFNILVQVTRHHLSVDNFNQSALFSGRFFLS